MTHARPSLLQRLSQVSVLLELVGAGAEGCYDLGVPWCSLRPGKGRVLAPLLSLFQNMEPNDANFGGWQPQYRTHRTPESPVGEDPFSSCWSSPAVCASIKGFPD